MSKTQAQFRSGMEQLHESMSICNTHAVELTQNKQTKVKDTLSKFKVLRKKQFSMFSIL